jgi:hypothetical protein
MVVTIFLAVLLCGGASASVTTAATAGWMVNGSLLSGTRALASTAQVTSAFQFEVAAASLIVECSGGELGSSKAEIMAPNMGSASSVTFKECSATSSCSVSPTLTTLPIVAEATLEGALEAKAVIKPKTKTVFGTFKFEGATCALLGVQPVTGKAMVKLPDGQMEETAQEVVLHTGAGELKVGSDEIVAKKGAYIRKLASALPWSFL